MPAFAPLESPELDWGVVDDVLDAPPEVIVLELDEDNDAVLEVPPEVIVLELDEDKDDVEEMKSAALYLMETPYPLTASVSGWSVTWRVVRATASVAVVVSIASNRETQACPGKLKAVSV